jgi:hypothetical protein
VDFEMSRGAIEELLECFFSVALGLTLEARILDAGDLPTGQPRCLTTPQREPPVCAAWHTNRGPVSGCTVYDRERALRIGAYVLWIEWWIASHEHHEGWWHCYPKRPCEWIKGAGTRKDSPSSS